MYTATTISSLRWRAKAFSISSRFIMLARLPSDHNYARRRVSERFFDGGKYFCRIGIPFDKTMLKAHDLADRFDDLDAILLRLGRRDIGLLAEQANDDADGEFAFDGDTADRVDGIEEAGVLHHQHRLMAGGVQTAAN